MLTPPFLTATDAGIILRVKVVPCAKKTKVAGVLGERLKICVSAPPEGGKANAAVCEFLAELLGIPVRDITIAQGCAVPIKTIRIAGVMPADMIKLVNPPT